MPVSSTSFLIKSSPNPADKGRHIKTNKRMKKNNLIGIVDCSVSSNCFVQQGSSITFTGKIT